MPRSFVPQALCVHSGWRWSSTRPSRRARPEYLLAGRYWFRVSDIPDSLKGGAGEGGWATVNGYGGGMQMLVSTWNRAARLARGRLPYASSESAIAGLPAAAQIFAAFLIVRADGWSWREWPETSRACGLP